MNTYYKILNEIASVFDMDQWDEQVNAFTDVIDSLLNVFVHKTECDKICILGNRICMLEGHVKQPFPQFNFYKKRCYVNGEKVKLDDEGNTENKWKDQKTVKVTIKDLHQLGESCSGMFLWCHSLVSVPCFDTSGVTNMKVMFHGCESLKTVPKFDTSAVTDMSHMFFNCASLESVPKFDTSSVTDMLNMFAWCNSLSEKTKQEWRPVYNFMSNKMK